MDPGDAVTVIADEQKKDYTKFLDTAGLNGKRIGFQTYENDSKKITALYMAAMELLKNQGAGLHEVELLKPVNESWDAEYNILKFEFKDGINKYLSKGNARCKSLAELIAFNKENAAKVMPYFDQERFEMCEEKSDLSSKEYLDSLKKSRNSILIIDSLMKEHNLDCIIGISVGPANCIDLVNGDYDTGFSFCSPAAMAGYPHITVPMGTVQELPVGLSFMASAYQEPLLFTVAYAYEQASKKRKQPAFLKTATAY
jgi:amidase